MNTLLAARDTDVAAGQRPRLPQLGHRQVTTKSEVVVQWKYAQEPSEMDTALHGRPAGWYDHACVGLMGYDACRLKHELMP